MMSRPRKYKEKTTTISFRLPVSIKDFLYSNTEKNIRAQWVVEAIVEKLSKEGKI